VIPRRTGEGVLEELLMLRYGEFGLKVEEKKRISPVGRSSEYIC